ncbi:MAG: MFS transporter [Lachnospiraceae bacterium]
MGTQIGNKAKKRQILGFSFNNASTNIVFITLSTYFLIYCTEIYGMSPVTVGLIMTGTRLFDAVTDPIIGILIDRTDTRFGRFRPWIICGAVISATSFITMFSGLKTGSTMGNYVLITLLYSVFVIGYTMQTACTKSAQTIVTSDKQQRTILNTLGMIWTMIIYGLVLGTVLPIVNGAGGKDVVTGWKKAAVIIGITQVIFATIVFFALRKKDIPENYNKLGQTSRPNFKDYIDIFAHNRALQMLIVAASTNKIAQTITGGMTVVFYFYVVQNEALQGVVPLINMVFAIMFMFISVKIINKLGRVETFRLSSIAGCLYGFAMIPLIAMNPHSMIWLVLVFGINAMMISGTTDQNLISMIADSADYEYYKNGRFIPGMIGTAFSFVDKIISSLSSTLVGLILGAAGFVSITETPISNKMFWTVLITFCAAPAIGHFFSIIGMQFHPLKKDVHEKMLQDMAERK